MTPEENATAAREATLQATIRRLESDLRMYKWHIQRNTELQDWIAHLEHVIEIRNTQIEALNEGLAKRDARIAILRKSLAEADLLMEGLRQDLRTFS
ncbi:MAG: hypothetical protein NTX48_00085 [Planctomycetales bacterium]|nr:hypothetical protein [Planctomycetales bacterium]